MSTQTVPIVYPAPLLHDMQLRIEDVTTVAAAVTAYTTSPTYPDTVLPHTIVNQGRSIVVYYYYLFIVLLPYMETKLHNYILTLVLSK